MLLCSASKCFIKAFKTFIKSFEAPQRSVNNFSSVCFLSSSGLVTGSVEVGLKNFKGVLLFRYNDV